MWLASLRPVRRLEGRFAAGERRKGEGEGRRWNGLPSTRWLERLVVAGLAEAGLEGRYRFAAGEGRKGKGGKEENQLSY